MIDRAQIDGLVAPLERDDLKLAILRNEARLIVAWYNLPRHQARSFRGPAAIDNNTGTSDERRGVRGEEQGRAHHVLDCAKSAKLDF